MTAHLRIINETYMAIDWKRLPVSQAEYLPQVYDFSFQKSQYSAPALYLDTQGPLVLVTFYGII